MLKALKSSEAPTEQLSREDFSTPGITFQIGVDPLRIDILTTVDGLTFDEAWRNKRVTGRTQELSLIADTNSDEVDWESGRNLRFECMECFGEFQCP